MQVADAIIRFYPRLNRDLVITGILLHDIAKTWELSYECAFGYTDSGQLVGHIVKSAIWVEQKAQAAGLKLGQPIPQPLVDVLQHIIISHHGQLEFGAAKVPATPEAIAVHFIENMDAKLMMSLSSTRGELPAADAGNWTEYNKALGTRLYRPDVAPPEGNAPTPTPEPRRTIDTSTSQAGSPPASRPPTMKVAVSNPLFESAPTAPRRK
jgi:3'-5' exoribonuclease